MLDLLHGVDGRGLGQAARIQLGQFIEEVESGRALAYSAASASAAGTGMPPHMPSVLKVYLSDLGARLAEFSVETLGLEAGEFRPEAGTWNFWDDYLYSLLFPIAGGANEVQQEIIGLRRFGIPRS
jgi:acyl-CoA dehydrogenase